MGDRTDRRSVLGTRNDSEQENRAMTETTITATRTIRNGVDTAAMFAPLDALRLMSSFLTFCHTHSPGRLIHGLRR